MDGEMMAQAKRYATGREFARGGGDGGQGGVEIDYCNGSRIWERIAILAKWFGGDGPDA